jgi:hypothetical protein
MKGKEIKAIESATSLFEILKIIDQIELDPEFVKFNILSYLENIPSYRELSDEFDNHLKEAGSLEDYIKSISSADLSREEYISSNLEAIKKHFTLETATDSEITDEMLKEFLKEDYIKVRTGEQRIRFNLHAMSTLWQSHDEISGGFKKCFSSPDPSDPYDTNKPCAELDPAAILAQGDKADEIFKEKINYANFMAQQNDSTIGTIAIAEGAHWTLLAIDFEKQQFRLVNSMMNEKDKKLLDLITRNYPEFKEYVPDELAEISSIREDIDHVNAEIEIQKNKLQEIKEAHILKLLSEDESSPLNEKAKDYQKLSALKGVSARRTSSQKKALENELFSTEIFTGELRGTYDLVSDKIESLNERSSQLIAARDTLTNNYRQQSDDFESCALWVLENARNILQKGIEAKLAGGLETEMAMTHEMRIVAYRKLFSEIVSRGIKEAAVSLEAGVAMPSRDALARISRASSVPLERVTTDPITVGLKRTSSTRTVK